jgi:hypothetical protein
MPQSLYIHHNCYAMLEEVRTDLNEYNTALVQGSEVGAYDNSDIVRKINQAQKYIWGLLFQRYPEMFLTSADVTGSSGSYTVPSDLYRLSHIINSDGEKISPISAKVKHLTNSTGSDYLYYRYGNTIVRDGGGSSALTFFYYKTVKDLTQGMSSAGGALSLTLDTTAKPLADYYNGITIENITDGWSDTISDYSAARVCTITQTGAASKYYGTVSELPEPFHSLISRRATLMLKNTVTSPQDNKATEMSDFREDLIETLRSYAGTREDVSLDEVFYSFEPFY